MIVHKMSMYILFYIYRVRHVCDKIRRVCVRYTLLGINFIIIIIITIEDVLFELVLRSRAHIIDRATIRS